MRARRTLTGCSQAKQQVPPPNVCDYLSEAPQSTQRLHPIWFRSTCHSESEIMASPGFSELTITATSGFAAIICHGLSWP